jgi:hypothetical protein
LIHEAAAWYDEYRDGPTCWFGVAERQSAKKGLWTIEPAERIWSFGRIYSPAVLSGVVNGEYWW